MSDPRQSPSSRPGGPIGAILAGGRGARIGGAKATVQLHGEPLISYPLRALRGALGEVVVIAKPDTQLPSLPGVTVWIEPVAPQHPLVGITHAIALAEGRPVVVCAVDLPLVSSEVVRALAEADPGGAPAVIATSGGRMQPLLGCYQPTVPALLGAAALGGAVPVRQAIGSLHPRLLEVDYPEALFNVNTPDDLLQAAAMLDRRRAEGVQPNVKS